MKPRMETDGKQNTYVLDVFKKYLVSNQYAIKCLLFLPDSIILLTTINAEELKGQTDQKWFALSGPI